MYVIDLLITWLLMMPVFIWYCSGLFGEQSGVFLLGWSRYVFFGWLLLRWLYLGIGWSLPKGTPGSRITKLSVRTNSGGRLPLSRSLIRSAGYLLLVIGWIPALFTKRRQTLHDLIAGSLVLSER